MGVLIATSYCAGHRAPWPRSAKCKVSTAHATSTKTSLHKYLGEADRLVPLCAMHGQQLPTAT